MMDEYGLEEDGAELGYVHKEKKSMEKEINGRPPYMQLKTGSRGLTIYFESCT